MRTELEFGQTTLLEELVTQPADNRSISDPDNTIRGAGGSTIRGLD